MGPLSSLFDLATFALLELGFKADIDVFRTAWFTESIATQILVIFVIRTTQRAWTSRPNRILLRTSLGALAVALSVALTSIGRFAGFVPLPMPVLAAIAGITVVYLAAAEALKPLAMR
jgi:Mg2+-importing ATPase